MESNIQKVFDLITLTSLLKLSFEKQLEGGPSKSLPLSGDHTLTVECCPFFNKLSL